MDDCINKETKERYLIKRLVINRSNNVIMVYYISFKGHHHVEEVSDFLNNFDMGKGTRQSIEIKLENLKKICSENQENVNVNGN